MKLVVLGATGGTGIEVIRRALGRRHSVVALARSLDRLSSFANLIEMRQGNLLDPRDLEKALQGCDAVVSAFGPRYPVKKGEENLLQDFSNVLIPAMEQAKVRRVVLETNSFLFKDSVMPPTYLFGRLFFKDILRDSAAMEKIFEESNLDWTFVRPPRLTDGPATDKYRTQVGHLPTFGFSISRADVADSIIKAAENPATIRQILGVAK